jgi:DMSO/TMAO reductase YedYZ heme-binding membrane subunit
LRLRLLILGLRRSKWHSPFLQSGRAGGGHDAEAAPGDFADTWPDGLAARRTGPGRAGTAPRQWAVDVCGALAGAGLGVSVGWGLITLTRGSLSAPGGLATTAGELAGLAGGYLLLIMVLLIARLPLLELSVGQARLLRWHRNLAPWAFGLICSHVLFITLGYAQAARVNVARQVWVFIRNYPDVLAAIVGFGLLAFAVITSWQRPVRGCGTRPGGSCTCTPTSRWRSRSRTRS